MKLNRKSYIAGMVIGGLLLFSTCVGLNFAMDHLGQFLNVALVSDPAATSSTNTIVLASLAAGLFGLTLLALSIVSFVRSSHPRL